jgi:hypothetical protein
VEFGKCGIYLGEITVGCKCKKQTTADNLHRKTEKKKPNNEQPTHKTAQTGTRPKLAEELFSCPYTHR